MSPVSTARTHFSGRPIGLLAARKKLRKHVGVFAFVVAESKLREIQRQIRFADFVVAAHYAAPEQGPETFDRLGVDFTAHKLIVLVRNEFMLVAKSPQVPVAETFIGGEQIDSGADCLSDEIVIRFEVRFFDHLAHDIAFARNRADHFGLALRCPFAAFPNVLVALFPAKVDLINLDHAHQLSPFLVSHGSAEPRAHVPSRVIIRRERIAVDRPVNLKRTPALLRNQHQVRDFEPNQKRLLRVLKDRIADYAEPMIAARLAEPIEWLGLERIHFVCPALRASHSIRPARRLQRQTARFLIRESAIKGV